MVFMITDQKAINVFKHYLQLTVEHFRSSLKIDFMTIPATFVLDISVYF